MTHRLRIPLLLVAGLVASGCSLTEAEESVPENVQVTAGCYSASYAGHTQGQIGCGIVQTLGRADVDSWFVGEIDRQRGFWQSHPATVYVFDECQGKANALSHPDNYIMFGKNVFWDRAYAANSFLAPTVILAHEWGHQVQFNNGWMIQTEPTVRRTELEADAYAGYYAMLAYSWDPDAVRVLLTTLYGIGDFEFSNRNHHGTPRQRLIAGAIGYDTAVYAVNNGLQLTYGELHAVFTELIGEVLSGTRASTERRSQEHSDLIDYVRSTGFDFDEEGYRDVPLETRRQLFPKPDNALQFLTSSK